MDVAQPIWLSDCPKEDLFIAKNAHLPFLDARAEIEKKICSFLEESKTRKKPSPEIYLPVGIAVIFFL